MPRVELDVETWLPPEKVRDALIDFSDRRPDIWPSLEPTLYEVYSVSETSADVKEGSKLPGKTIWAREQYDWSSPERFAGRSSRATSASRGATWPRRCTRAKEAGRGSTSTGSAPGRAS